jgi:hypothetical protein
MKIYTILIILANVVSFALDSRYVYDINLSHLVPKIVMVHMSKLFLRMYGLAEENMVRGNPLAIPLSFTKSPSSILEALFMGKSTSLPDTSSMHPKNRSHREHKIKLQMVYAKHP